MSEHEVPDVGFGTTVYDADGNELGRIRGLDEHGFYVTDEGGIAEMSLEHLRAGPEFGEAELTWRCRNCGEVGDLTDEFPEGCPACGAAREEVYYWTED